MTFLYNTKEFRFPLGRFVLSACGQVEGVHHHHTDRTLQMETSTFTETDRLIFTMQAWLPPQPDPVSFQSHSAASH